MKVIISRPNLVSLIGTIQGVVPNKPSNPILINVLIEAYNEQLTITTINMTVSVRAHMVEVRILEEGAIALPARNFFQLIRELTISEITLTTSNNEIAYIEANNSQFRLNGVNKDEFPLFPDLTHTTHFSISSAILKEMLAKSSFSAARDDNRQLLNGVLMRVAEDNATFIGTNGKLLSKIYTPICLEKSSDQHDYLIPLKSVEEIMKIIDSEGDTEIFLMKEKIGVESGCALLITKLFLAQYPDVEWVIPEKTNFTLTLHREELMILLKQVIPFITNKSHSVLFSLNSGELTLTAQSNEVGEGRVSMSVNYSGEPFEIAFNPFFFYDILRHSNDETVFLALTEPYSPGLITDSTTANYIIMPMRLHFS